MGRLSIDITGSDAALTAWRQAIADAAAITARGGDVGDISVLRDDMDAERIVRPQTMAYYGGKVHGGKARWIESLLPAPSNEETYIEPFGGMPE